MNYRYQDNVPLEVFWSADMRAIVGETEIDPKRWTVLRRYFLGDTEEVVIHFTVEGHHTPARVGGPPEECHPEEGDEERTITAVEVDGHYLSADSAIADDRHAFVLLRDLLQEEVDLTPSVPPK